MGSSENAKIPVQGELPIEPRSLEEQMAVPEAIYRWVFTDPRRSRLDNLEVGWRLEHRMDRTIVNATIRRVGDCLYHASVSVMDGAGAGSPVALCGGLFRGEGSGALGGNDSAIIEASRHCAKMLDKPKYMVKKSQKICGMGQSKVCGHCVRDHSQVVANSLTDNFTPQPGIFRWVQDEPSPLKGVIIWRMLLEDSSIYDFDYVGKVAQIGSRDRRNGEWECWLMHPEVQHDGTHHFVYSTDYRTAKGAGGLYDLAEWVVENFNGS